MGMCTSDVASSKSCPKHPYAVLFHYTNLLGPGHVTPGAFTALQTWLVCSLAPLLDFTGLIPGESSDKSPVNSGISIKIIIRVGNVFLILVYFLICPTLPPSWLPLQIFCSAERSHY